MARFSGRTRRAAQAAGAAAVAVAATAALQTTVSAAPPGQAPTAAPATSTELPDVAEAERESLCRLNPGTIRHLLDGLPESSQVERARDAVWLLEDSVASWESAAEAVPSATAAVRLAGDVERAWREGVHRHDAGDSAGSRAAFARAEARLGNLDRSLRAAPIPGCS